MGAVASGDCTDEATAFVAEGERDAIDFGIGDKGDIRGLEGFGDTGVPLADVRFGVGVVDGEHREGVRTGLEALDGFTADADGRARRVGEAGMLLFEPDQLGHEGVELAVGHDRGVFDVVRAVGAIEKGTQLDNAGLGAGIDVDTHGVKGTEVRVSQRSGQRAIWAEYDE